LEARDSLKTVLARFIRILEKENLKEEGYEKQKQKKGTGYFFWNGEDSISSWTIYTKK
jgi:hypothetical protein